jgi:hypothetical protein
MIVVTREGLAHSQIFFLYYAAANLCPADLLSGSEPMILKLRKLSLFLRSFRSLSLAIVISECTRTWVYGTGNPYTLAEAKYKMIPGVNTDYFHYGQVYNDLNSYRMRSYHKLDIGINFNKTVKRGERTWSINIYNLYNRQNPYYYFLSTTYQFDQKGNIIPEGTKTVLKQQSYFPIIPSFSYSLKL